MIATSSHHLSSKQRVQIETLLNQYSKLCDITANFNCDPSVNS
jgi:F0F1-type ATP synthase delta subunit